MYVSIDERADREGEFRIQDREYVRRVSLIRQQGLQGEWSMYKQAHRSQRNRKDKGKIGWRRERRPQEQRRITSTIAPGDNEFSQHQYAWLDGLPSGVLSGPGGTEKKA